MAHSKVLFRIERDADGYPPADVEGIWCEEAQDGSFVVDNAPFFVQGVSLGDVIEARKEGGELHYTVTRRRSGNSLFRVVMFDGRDPSGLRVNLEQLGCSTELSHIPSLVAVSVPPNVSIMAIRDFLNEGCAQGFWDYEESTVRQ